MQPAKKRRQDALAAIVRSGDISSQAELRKMLAAKGIGVKQPTLSRDLREMAIVKVPRGLGRFSYRLRPETESVNVTDLRHKFTHIVREVRTAGNLVVIKTPPGEAQSVARLIDNAGMSDILGTVGGDDTIFCVARSVRSARKITRTFEEFRGGSRTFEKIY